MAAIGKGYDTTLQDCATLAAVQSFFHDARVLRRTCPNCGAKMHLVLCTDNTRLDVCDAPGCGWEHANEE